MCLKPHRIDKNTIYWTELWVNLNDEREESDVTNWNIFSFIHSFIHSFICEIGHVC